MKQPRLKIAKDGSRCLIVYYIGNEYDRAIDEAEAKLNPNGKPINVICFPISSKFNEYIKKGRDTNSLAGAERGPES